MCKIMDFGLAKGGGNASDAGTEVYKPPAVYSSTLRGDRFSMALVFYEIITGALPKRRLVEDIGNVVDLASFEALDDAVKGALGGPDVAELIKEMLDMNKSCTAADVKNRVQKIRKQIQGGEAAARK
jgi:serine/threonine protein kinase